ncbi:ABC transporter ATP-binding protein [Bradyrhizobium sp.]|uniref:ABC transporter ATP-binding protein n=1 Tax=Bradyrhizobium sp. TaxID=376 RepID=UPI001ECE68F5|nr:ABC transporter ATP-binding protein [Bradyrhizobium sp.]MBV8918329.1 ABC transporter ATP-binding protein [Bradyrhizobium sp.]MBV9983027.1 ABC transporter ATP-binding protein [Bradyrhizobium sp.]
MLAPPRGAVAILGRNGAGKSTLLKTIAGEIRPMSGIIRFDQQQTVDEPSERRVRRGLGYVPQEHGIFDRLTVRENLLLGAINQKDKSGIDRVLAIFPKLARRLAQTAATLSGGERKMLAIGRALVGWPKLLMLDEPTEGVWVGVIDEIAERLAELAKSISLVVVEQHIELALSVAQYAYVMDRGSIALEGPAGRVRADANLARYLSP